jgi:hypothetical protein
MDAAAGMPATAFRDLALNLHASASMLGSQTLSTIGNLRESDPAAWKLPQGHFSFH